MGGDSGFPVSRYTASPGGVMAIIGRLFKQYVPGPGLDFPPPPPYSLPMTSPTARTLESLTAALERSEAQLAAGQTVPLEPVVARLRASIARMESRQAKQSAQARKA